MKWTDRMFLNYMKRAKPYVPKSLYFRIMVGHYVHKVTLNIRILFWVKLLGRSRWDLISRDWQKTWAFMRGSKLLYGISTPKEEG